MERQLTQDMDSDEPLLWEERRTLAVEDWALKESASTIPPLQAIRASHHQLARLLADGIGPTEAASITGYCPSRVSILQNDPAFAQLVAFYAARKDELLIDVNGRIKTIALDALEVIHERVLTSPDTVSTKDLQALVDSGLDRIGHGRTSKSVSITANLTSEDVKQMREAAGLPAVISRKDYLDEIGGEPSSSGVPA